MSAFRTWDQISAQIPPEQRAAVDAAVRQAFNLSLQELADQCDRAGSPLNPMYISSIVAASLPPSAESEGP